MIKNCSSALFKDALRAMPAAANIARQQAPDRKML
jgi:hypothetical protein